MAGKLKLCHTFQQSARADDDFNDDAVESYSDEVTQRKKRRLAGMSVYLRAWDGV